MKAFFRYTAWLVAASLLVGMLAFLYMKTRALDSSQRTVVNGLVRDLKQLDADWNVEVLRSKTGLSSNYDQVTQPQLGTLAAQKAIAARSAGLFDPRLKEAQTQLNTALATKIDLIDQFKAQNAILRNSMRFIPLAAEDLKGRARKAAESAPGAANEMLTLVNRVDEVLIETLKLGNGSDSAAIGRIRSLVGPLVSRPGEFPQPVAESLRVFVNHLVTILAQKEREEELFVQLAKLPVVERIDEVSGAFESAFERAGDNRETYHVALFAYSAFLLALLAFMGWRMRRNYLEVSRLNVSLVRANEILRSKAGQAA